MVKILKHFYIKINMDMIASSNTQIFEINIFKSLENSEAIYFFFFFFFFFFRGHLELRL